MEEKYYIEVTTKRGSKLHFYIDEKFSGFFLGTFEEPYYFSTMSEAENFLKDHLKDIQEENDGEYKEINIIKIISGKIKIKTIEL